MKFKIGDRVRRTTIGMDNDYNDNDDNDITSQIILAKTFLNKKCIANNITFTPINVVIRYKGDSSSIIVNKYLETHDVCVCLSSSSNISPITSVSLLSTTKSIKLNDNYKAIISKETITVGCQTFPISILKDINEALNSL